MRRRRKRRPNNPASSTGDPGDNMLARLRDERSKHAWRASIAKKMVKLGHLEAHEALETLKKLLANPDRSFRGRNWDACNAFVLQYESKHAPQKMKIRAGFWADHIGSFAEPHQLVAATARLTKKQMFPDYKQPNRSVNDGEDGDGET